MKPLSKMTRPALPVGWTRAQGQITNKEFAESDAHFQACCGKANVKPTARQASKWRRHTGQAWAVHLKSGAYSPA